jgi:hypothetical protein
MIYDDNYWYVYHGFLQFAARFSVTVCDFSLKFPSRSVGGGGVVGPNVYPYTSTLLLVHVSNKKEYLLDKKHTTDE